MSSRGMPSASDRADRTAASAQNPGSTRAAPDRSTGYCVQPAPQRQQLRTWSMRRLSGATAESGAPAGLRAPTLIGAFGPVRPSSCRSSLCGAPAPPGRGAAALPRAPELVWASSTSLCVAWPTAYADRAIATSCSSAPRVRATLRWVSALTQVLVRDSHVPHDAIVRFPTACATCSRRRRDAAAQVALAGKGSFWPRPSIFIVMSSRRRLKDRAGR